MTLEDVDSRLDVCGICCPMPIIRLAKSIKDLRPGQTLEISGNDPIFETSIREFCQAGGHAVLDVKASDKHVVTMRIKVGA